MDKYGELSELFDRMDTSDKDFFFWLMLRCYAGDRLREMMKPLELKEKIKSITPIEMNALCTISNCINTVELMETVLCNDLFEGHY